MDQSVLGFGLRKLLNLLIDWRPYTWAKPAAMD